MKSLFPNEYYCHHLLDYYLGLNEPSQVFGNDNGIMNIEIELMLFVAQLERNRLESSQTALENEKRQLLQQVSAQSAEAMRAHVSLCSEF